MSDIDDLEAAIKQAKEDINRGIPVDPLMALLVIDRHRQERKQKRPRPMKWSFKLVALIVTAVCIVAGITYAN